MKNDLTWNGYSEYVDIILNSENPPEPYNDAEYKQYALMNRERSNRWLKTFQPLPETLEAIESISEPQEWVLITEPWCGDAAHVNPIVYLLSELSDKINLTIQLRDTDSEIESYLTNGTKSIPILIIRNSEGKDLAVWGPRPKGAQALFNELKSQGVGKEDYILALQKWYNADKTIGIQQEIAALVKGF